MLPKLILTPRMISNNFYVLLICLSFITVTHSIAGPCDYPDDIASDGSRCGGRASSVRPGGRNPDTDWLIWVGIIGFGAFCAYLVLARSNPYQSGLKTKRHNLRNFYSTEESKESSTKEKFQQAQFMNETTIPFQKIKSGMSNKVAGDFRNNQVKNKYNEEVSPSFPGISSTLSQFKINAEQILKKQYSFTLSMTGLQLFEDLVLKYHNENKNEYDVAMMYILYQMEHLGERRHSSAPEFIEIQSRNILGAINNGTAPRTFILFKLNEFRKQHSLTKIY